MRKLDGFAIVTGSARGLGAATVERLAQDGYDVVINHVSDRSKTPADALAAKVISDYGVKAVVLKADVTQYDECKRLVAEAIAALGDKIAALVNNAGIDIGAHFVDEPVAEYERMIASNLLGPMHMTHVVLPHMIKQGYGAVVSLSSIAGTAGWVDQVDYSAAKAGLIGFTKALAKEYGANGITFNAVAPGVILTDMVRTAVEQIGATIEDMAAMVPLNRVGDPMDIGDAIAYCVGAPFLTGQIISPNGGAVI
jgi:3-oxoacyl-[acyl-carrier protein] reductase